MATIQVARDKLGESGTLPQGLLLRLAATTLAFSEKAFKQQKYGSEDWKPRYPNQTPPKINVVGAIKDLMGDGEVKSRRFQDRPALTDTGELKRHLDFDVFTNEFDITNNLPYAPLQQEGGESTIQLNQEFTKKDGKLSKFLKKNPQYSPKLGFLFNKVNRMKELTYTTTVVGRQFTPTADKFPETLEDEISDIIQEFFE